MVSKSMQISYLNVGLLPIFWEQCTQAQKAQIILAFK